MSLFPKKVECPFKGSKLAGPKVIKNNIKIVRVTAVAQSYVYQATRILFVHKNKQK